MCRPLFGFSLSLLFLLLPLVSRGQEPLRPHTREEWVERLCHLPDPLGRDDYLFLNQFQALDAKTVFQMVQENWTKIKSDHGRTHIVQYTAFEPQNPYLLAVLHMGRTDRAPRVQEMAIRSLRLLTFQDFTDLQTYHNWYREQGKLPLREVARRGCQHYTDQIRGGSLPEKLRLLTRFLEIPFASSEANESSQSGTAPQGLMQIRREAVLLSGLMPLLCAYLSEANPPALRRVALVCIAHFQPDGATLHAHEKAIQSLLPALLTSSEATLQERLELLASLHSEWAIPPLIEIAQEEFGETNSSLLVRVLLKTENLRVVPLLVTFLEALERESEEGESREEIERGLTRVTGQRLEGGAKEWRNWWNRSGCRQIASPHAPLFPRLALRRRGAQRVLRHLVCPIYPEKCPQPAYWHISSGKVWTQQKGQNGQVGLIVMLYDPKHQEIGKVAQQWQEALQIAFQGNYVVAMVPHTRQTSTTTESVERVAWATKDALATLPIDPLRVWLMAEGEQAEILYASAFAPKSTLFHGFWLIDPPFHTAWLSATKTLSSGRFLLQFSAESRQVSPLVPSLTQNTLRRLQARVRLLPQEKTSSPLISLKEGISWLENRGRANALEKGKGLKWE